MRMIRIDRIYGFFLWLQTNRIRMQNSLNVESFKTPNQLWLNIKRTSCETDINDFLWLLNKRKDYKNVLKLTARLKMYQVTY